MSTLTLPFVHLNLRWNPFGEADRADRAAMAVVDVTPWVAHLRAPGSAVRFVGAHGRGKSTRLHALCRELPDAMYFRAAREEPPSAAAVRAAPEMVLVIDEFGMLSRRLARSLTEAATRLVVAMHDGQSDGLRAAGFDVLTVPVRGLDVQQLRAICDARIEWARRASGAVPSISAEAAGALIDRFGDDVRAIESRLYDVLQHLDTPRPVLVEDVYEPEDR